MHSNAPHTAAPAGSTRGDGRVRRIAAVLAIGVLPLIAAACAKPAGPTDVGAGAGGPGSSSRSSSGSSAPATSSGGADGSSGSAQPSGPSIPSSGAGGGSSTPDSDTNSEEPPVGSGVPDSLKGSAWTSTSITGRQAVKGAPLKISFDATGERSGLHAGCNSMGGGPVFDGDTLAFPQIVSTMMACVGGGGAIMKQESWYSKWLKQGVDYTAAGSKLTLEGAGVTVVFARTGDADEAPASSGDPDRPTSDGGMTTQAVPVPVATPRTPIPGATIEPGSQGSAIPIPPTTK